MIHPRMNDMSDKKGHVHQTPQTDIHNTILCTNESKSNNQDDS